MNKKRLIKDRIILGGSWFLSLISVFVLIVIMVFIFRLGMPGLSADFISGDYYSVNVIAKLLEGEAFPETFTRPGNLSEEAVFSEKFGIALIDTVDKHKSAAIAFDYVDPHSPFAQVEDQNGERFHPHHGNILKYVNYYDESGGKARLRAGSGGEENAAVFIEKLDKEAVSVADYFTQTIGGGIRGSIITSVMLVGITLIIVLPVGIAAAIWLNEVAKKNRLTAIVRTGIDMLAGVPSIIFGLMGMTMLYPITAAFGIQGQSVVLGGLTMSVVLLPLVIRQTEEALKTVPVSMRMGSLSLGASQTQTIFKVVLPQAMPGIITACLLSISRIIGESAALIYTMGTAISDNPAFRRGATTMALHIWKVMSGEQPDFEQATAISIVILVLVLVLNFSTRMILSRISKAQLGSSK